jgi:putative Holliday junction resolvase
VRSKGAGTCLVTEDRLRVDGMRLPPRRVLALDPGKVRVGVAISDELGVLASPRPALDGRDQRRMMESIRAICADEEVGRLLVGLPLEMSGARGPAARKALAFAKRVADATGLEVELVDERLSTVEAARRLDEAGRRRDPSRSTVIDGAAACVLLQAWLEGRPPERGSPG